MNLATGSRKANDALTVVAVGVAAATLAAVAHETIGHGLGCSLAGGRVRLLTSIFFRCSVVSPLSDAGGSLGNLVAAALALGLASRRARGGAGALLLVMFGCINGFWFSAQIVHDALLNQDDWAFLRYLQWSLAWRSGAIAIGLFGYVATMRVSASVITRSGSSLPNAVPLCYLAAATAGFVPGLMWRPDPVAGTIEDFLTFAVTPVGLLLVWARVRRSVCPDDSRPIDRSLIWIISSFVIFAVFLVVQGRGLGELSHSALVR